MSRITKNKKRIDPRYFLHETTHRDQLDEVQNVSDAKRKSYQLIRSMLVQAGYSTDDMVTRPHPKLPMNDILVIRGTPFAQFSNDGEVSFHEALYRDKQDLFDKMVAELKKMGHKHSTSIETINFKKGEY